MPFQRATTISHFHTDPKLIQQINSVGTLSLGQFVFLDTDGIYKPGLSSGTEQQSNILGVVWDFLGNDAFYIKCEYGPVEYRFPAKSSFSVPGTIGQEIYLSETVAGGMQTAIPSGIFGFIVGYKTDYGLLYRPSPTFCCAAPSSCSIPAINSSLNVSGTTSVPFSYTITATNSPTSFACTSANLPSGLSFDGVNTISGIPTANGTFYVPISATNDCGTDNETLTMTIAYGGE